MRFKGSNSYGNSRAVHVLVQVAQDAIALVDGDAQDSSGEAAIDVERLAAGHRVGTDDRMLGRG